MSLWYKKLIRASCWDMDVAILYGTVGEVTKKTVNTS